MPAVKGSAGGASHRPPASPVKRKKSVARSPSPRGHHKARSDDHSPAPKGHSLSALEPLRSSRKPPLAPAPSHATTDSSPANSIEPSPRPSSPVPTGDKKAYHAAVAAAPTTARGADDAATGKDRVRVYVRLRPMREGEGEEMIRFDDSSNGRRIWLPSERGASGEGTAPLQFDFDGILPSDIAQQSVYETVARPLVDAATSGHAACLMCYGQTGTGKTYTFGGGELLRTQTSTKSSPRVPGGGTPSKEAKRERQQREQQQQRGGGGDHARAGVVGRALRQVLEWAAPRGMRVCVAYLQVYMELLQDLLRPESALTLREHPDLGVYVDGACWHVISSGDAACGLVAEADARRATAFTKLNADSSRSHAVLMIAIRNAADVDAISPAAPPAALSARTSRQLSSDAEWASARGRLFLVDLAGSERTKRSGVVGQSFEEAVSINQSLTTLGRCIQALATAKSVRNLANVRAPVRESKLTRLLSPCLGGATTSLVCCVSAAFADRFETLNTLEFGRNAMRVLLKPQSQLGVDFKALTIQLQAQLDERQQAVHELEASVYARVHAEYAGRLADLEKERRTAEAARHAAELKYDRVADAEKAADQKAKAATGELARLQNAQESAVKTSRASHDSRAAIIATADSLAEEVVRARRDRDEALHQLELLSAQLGAASGAGVRPVAPHGHALGAGASGAHGAVGGAAGAHGGVAVGVDGVEMVIPKLPDDASAVERECAGAIAELAGYRAQVERRKMRARAAAARAMPGGGLGGGGGLSGGGGGGEAVSEARVAADRKAVLSLRSSITGLLGGVSELLASAVELTETQHPELWRGAAEQLLLTDQIRTSQRLVHMLGRISSDFGAHGNSDGGT